MPTDNKLLTESELEQTVKDLEAMLKTGQIDKVMQENPFMQKCYLMLNALAPKKTNEIVLDRFIIGVLGPYLGYGGNEADAFFLLHANKNLYGKPDKQKAFDSSIEQKMKKIYSPDDPVARLFTDLPFRSEMIENYKSKVEPTIGAVRRRLSR